MPLSQERVLEEVYSRFEAAWRAGQRPRIEDYLGPEPDPVRPAVLLELIALDIDYRRRAGERPTRRSTVLAFPCST
jgi:serine/threonine-protein kinase